MIESLTVLKQDGDVRQGGQDFAAGKAARSLLSEEQQEIMLNIV